MVVESVNGTAVRSLADLKKAIGALKSGQAVSLVVRLPDGTQTIINYRMRG